MKKMIAAICLLLVCALVSACAAGGGEEDRSAGRTPRAFGILQRGTTVEKRACKGESVVFSRTDIEPAVGSGFGFIALTALPDPLEGVLTYCGESVIRGQTLPAAQLGSLRFIPAAGSSGGEFGFTCDSPGWENSELRCRITLGAGENLPPVANGAHLRTVAGVQSTAALRFADPEGDECTVKVISYPKNGGILVDSAGKATYTPAPGFTGSDKMVFSLVDRFGAESLPCALEITVDENRSGVVFSDMLSDPAHLHAQRLAEREIMTYKQIGGDYVFEPDLPVTRMDFLVMLMCATGRADSVAAVADSAAADDAGLSSGLKGFISAAAAQGVIALENGEFRPGEAITVDEAAAMTAAATGLAVKGSENAFDLLVRAGMLEIARPGGEKLDRRTCAELLYGAAGGDKNE